MFSVKDNECVGFESRWRVKKVYSEGTSQTTEYSLAETSTNTTTNVEVETQTGDDIKNDTADADMQKLADWLTRIYPKVQKELNDANTSKAFRGEHYLIEESIVADAKLIQTLNVTGSTGDGDTALQVNVLAWNSTGNTLAVSCNHSHKTWCHHLGHIRLYTLDRDDQFPNTSHKKLTTTACVTVLKFHPTLPSIIASGSHSGEVIIWNIQHNDENNVVVKISGHEERITEMLWIRDVNDTKSLLLVTSGLDGFLNLYSFSLPSASLVIKQKYKIKSPVSAKIRRSSELPEEISKKVVRGVLSFDFSIHVLDMFVVGIEGGLIIQCSTLSTNLLKGSTKDVPVSDPAFRNYKPHEGEINAVRFSPNRREMFMTNGSDGEIRIYIIGQDSPARIIFLEKQLNQVSWVPYQEKLITGCGEEGLLKIFDLIRGQSVPNITTEKVVQTRLLTLEVNRQRCNTIAIGNDRGEIQLWTVPWNAFASQIVS